MTCLRVVILQAPLGKLLVPSKMVDLAADNLKERFLEIV